MLGVVFTVSATFCFVSVVPNLTIFTLKCTLITEKVIQTNVLAVFQKIQSMLSKNKKNFKRLFYAVWAEQGFFHAEKCLSDKHSSFKIIHVSYTVLLILLISRTTWILIDGLLGIISLFLQCFYLLLTLRCMQIKFHLFSSQYFYNE